MCKSALFLAILGMVSPALAQENDDLNLIPGAVQNAPPPVPDAVSRGKYSLENAMGWYSYRGSFAVPVPGGVPSRWANRTSFDGLDQWKLSDDVSLAASDRFSMSFSDGISFPADSLRNDLREAYVTWEAAPQTYLEAGRINVRNGVAYGYNPTDFFAGRTAVAQSSSDPGAQRLNRLGTVMARAQHFFDGGAVEVIYAPKLHKAVAIGELANPIDPKVDQTNGSDRFLAAFSFELEEFSPQVLVYHDGGRTKLGLNLSHPVGQSVIAYISWAGGEAPNVVADAIAFGKRTSMIPALAPVLPVVPLSRHFQNDLSLGAYWTSEYKVTVSAEYNFHEAGLSQEQWQDWFTTGANPALASMMWYIRSYASDLQQPMSRHQAFLRVDWQEPSHIQYFGVAAYVMSNLNDGSSIGQLSASYDVSDYWSVAAYLGADFGGRRSEWGSLRSAGSAIIQIVRYF